MSVLAILFIGFFLGMRHATDPDHVIAVSTIVSRERSLGKAGLIGALWGLGHTITIVLVGAGMILFNLVIPPRVGLTMEFSVGIMLILLGALNLTGTTKRVSEKYFPGHTHGLGEHAHSHDQPAASSSLSPGKLGAFHSLRPLFIGIVHGLAGSAAVALLVLTTIHEPRWAMLYLLIFGVGTIAGMMLITAAMAVPFSSGSTRFAWFNRGLVTGSGLLSLGFGIFIIYQIGVVDGLFTSHPNWTPS